jgi:DNA-binding CsgD family transcriptional regulator
MIVGHRYYEDVASARDIASFKYGLVAFAECLDFPLINATLVVEQPSSKPTIVAVRNTPPGFASETTHPQKVQRDPVVQRLQITSIPFAYDQSTYVDNGAGELWEEQAPFGYRTGISMAMHLSGGRHFVLGIDRREALPKNPDLVMRLMADLQLLAVHALEPAARLLLPLTALDHSVPTLSSREQEILRWTRDGKSSAVIGHLMNISRRTVNFHLSSAMGKLGVASKFQAAAKAQSLGLL